MTEVTVIDYGVGNLLSVSRALEQCGARVTITSDAGTILASARVVLPGVGAYADGMAALQSKGLDEVVRQIAAIGTPLMGICLGMQMLMDESEEFCVTPGLSLIPGRVVRIPATATTGEPHKIPHVGWSNLEFPAHCDSWQSDLLADVEPGDAVYFVHSYMAVPTSSQHRIADCCHGGHRISAVLRRENVVGCQFHPEKSGEVGLKILSRFLAK